MSVQSEVNRLNTAKTGLKTAIENGGVSVSFSEKIDAYPSIIDEMINHIKAQLDEINGEVV